MGEAWRLEGNTKMALKFYTDCYNIQQDLDVLFKILLLNGKDIAAYVGIHV